MYLDSRFRSDHCSSALSDLMQGVTLRWSWTSTRKLFTMHLGEGLQREYATLAVLEMTALER